MSHSDESLGAGAGSGEPMGKGAGGGLGAGAGSGQPMGKGAGGGVGRGDGQGSEGTSGSGYVASRHCSPQPASVVIRATVEHIGLVGDTELTVNVKWPASIFCVQPCEKPAAPSGPASDSQNVPANGPDASNFQTLTGEAGFDPAPFEELKKLRSEIAKLASEGDPTKLKAAIAELNRKTEHTCSASEAENSGSASEAEDSNPTSPN